MSDITRNIPLIVGGKIKDVEVTLPEAEWENTTDQKLRARFGDTIALKAAPKAKKASA